LKVYEEELEGDTVNKKWYRVKNAEDVLGMEICSGDTLNIKGLGELEVFGVFYEFKDEGKNPYRSLEITCGMITV
jgi:hypothetical protein